MVLTLPFIYPVIVALGFDPIWFGVIAVILMEMGLITPPVGMNAFALAGVCDIPLNTIFRGNWPLGGGDDGLFNHPHLLPCDCHLHTPYDVTKLN
jgi:TRAP-type C4-dicarboxylate transport system permease large subunit